jgi:hypothetical protein
MGFLSKINKKLGFSKGTKERMRALKRREALGLNPKYVEDPMGRILSPRGRFNQSALDRRVAEMTALNPGMNFGDQIGYTRPNKNPSMPIAFNDPSFRMTGTPQPIARRDPSALERLPMGGAPSFNPTIFGQPIPQGADFSNMPDFSQIDMSQLDLSGIPQSISQMNLPQMPEGLPSMEEIQGNRRMPQMGRGRMQPRQMMNYGGEMKGYAEGDEAMMMQENEMMAPNGGEIEAMLGGMGAGEQEAMGELEQMAPEMEMIDQLVMMVAQMIQQGAGEEEVIGFLREQGLDDEDIGTVLQLVAEMAETEEVAAQNEIGADLEQLG